MKKTISILFMFLYINGYSQFSFAPKVSFLKASVERESYFDTKPKESFGLGFYGEYKFNKFAINAELNYQKNGFKADRDEYRESPESPPILIKGDYSINQINLCLSAKYYFIDKFSLRAGGYYGRILSYKIDASIPGTNSSQNIDASNQMQKQDYGLVFGLEYVVYKGIFIDASYYFGLNDISKTTRTPTNNRVLSFGLGYKFHD